MRNKVFFPLLLILTMLFTQLGGLTHGISHTLTNQHGSSGQSNSQDQSAPHDKHCDLCAAYAQIGSALGSHATQFTPFKQHAEFTLCIFGTFLSNTFTAFAARAPPYSA